MYNPNLAEKYKFICFAPYVVSVKNDLDNCTENLRDEEHALITQIFGRCLSWACDNKVITKTDGPQPGSVLYKRTTTAAKGSLPSIIITTNFRALICDPKDLKTFLDTIADTEFNYLYTRLIQFATTLTIMYGPEMISILINRIYQSYNAQPIGGEVMSWMEFHKKYPSLWVIILIQNAILGLTKE